MANVRHGGKYPKGGDFVRHMRKMFADTFFSEKAIETMYGYMDYHLKILGEAIKNGDKDAISFQKNQLDKVRERLVELEYFNFNQ